MYMKCVIHVQIKTFTAENTPLKSLSCFLYFMEVLGMEVPPLHRLGECSTTELQDTQPSYSLKLQIAPLSYLRRRKKKKKTHARPNRSHLKGRRLHLSSVSS